MSKVVRSSKGKTTVLRSSSYQPDPDRKVVTDAAIKRLSILAKIRTLDGDAKDMARTIILSEIDKLVKVSVSLAEHSGRKTVLYKDLEEAISRRGEKLYGSKKDVYKVCKNIIKKNSETKKGERRTRVNKKDYSGCVFIAKRQFVRLIRNSINEHSRSKDAMKMSRGFAETLQHYVEQNLIKIFGLSNTMAVTIGGRTTVQARDMMMVWEHRCRFN